MRDITVILPTRNEAPSLELVIDEVRQALGEDTPILVVDTNSTDGTRELALLKGVVVIDEPRRGKAFAIETGIREVGTLFLAIINADWTYPASYLATAYRFLVNGSDAVYGCRLIKEKDSMCWWHSIGNWGISLIASICYGKRVTDVCTGMKCFRSEKAKGFKLTSNGFNVEADLFISTVKNGLSLVEVPIAYRKRLVESKTKLNMLDGFRIALFLVRKRLAK